MKQEERALIDRLVNTLERIDLDRYIEHVSNRRRMIWNNLLFGILRGLGFSIGFTILGAVLIVVLQHLISDNMPLIGGFLAEVIHAIEERM